MRGSRSARRIATTSARTLSRSLLKNGLPSRFTVLKHLSAVVLPQPLRTSLLDLIRRSEEHTSELQSLMRISYAVFCLKQKTKTNTYPYTPYTSYNLEHISPPTHHHKP